MSDLIERTITVQGEPYRVWEKGEGEPLGFFPGWGGLPAWQPLLESLSARRRVIAPSLPGFPGGGRTHLRMDTHLDWAVAAQEILLGAGLEGADLMGVSAGGALAAEVAALWPSTVRRLVLGAPFGLFDEAEPVADLFAQAPGALAALACCDPARFPAALAAPEGAEDSEWQIEQTRAAEAVARYLWPLGNTGLKKRLGRITQPVLLLWGEEDQVIPPSYARRFADGIAGECTVRMLPGAGHLLHFDQPEEVSREVLAFLG